MKIVILNRIDFVNTINRNEITEDNLQEKGLFIISINDNNLEPYFTDTKSDRILNLKFDDVSGPEKGKIMFNENMGEQVINFLEKIKSSNCRNLLIHCTAGQNRSGSVGKFAADFFKIPHSTLMIANPYIKGNPVVSRILNKLYFWSKL
jgi:predicted protein tyrosine phosphatase